MAATKEATPRNEIEVTVPADSTWDTCTEDIYFGEVLSEQIVTLNGKPLKIQVRPFCTNASRNDELITDQIKRDFFGIFITYHDDSGKELTRFFRTIPAPSRYRQIGKKTSETKVEREAQLVQELDIKTRNIRRSNSADAPSVVRKLVDASPVRTQYVKIGGNGDEAFEETFAYEYFEGSHGGWTIGETAMGILADTQKRMACIDANTKVSLADKENQKDGIKQEAKLINAVLLIKALDILRKYNELGYIHEHAHLRNFTVDANGITLIDFSSAYNEATGQPDRSLIFEGFPEDFIFIFYIGLSFPAIARQFGIEIPDTDILKEQARKFCGMMSGQGITDKKALADEGYKKFRWVLQLQRNIEATLAGTSEGEQQALMAKVDAIMLRNQIRAIYKTEPSDASLAQVFDAIHEAVLHTPTITYPTKTAPLLSNNSKRRAELADRFRQEDESNAFTND